MALTINATTISSIWTCESVTGAVGNKPALDNEIYKEGSNSVDFTSTGDVYAAFDGTIPNSGDLSNQHIRAWYTSITFPNMDVYASDGLRFYVTDGSTISYWNIAGKDTYQGGWINAVIDIEAPDTDNSINTASVTELGFIMSYATSPKNLINTWVDYFRYGDGYTCYGTAWDLADVAASDITSGYGIVDIYQNAIILFGNLQIGRNSEQTTYSESGSVIIFADANVSSTLYGLDIIGYSTSTFEFDGCVLTAAGTQDFYLNFDDTGIADLSFTGNTIQKASIIAFRDSSTACIVTGNTFSSCTTITTNGCTFNGNTMSTITTVNLGATTPTGNILNNITNLNLTATLIGGSITSSEQIDITSGSAGLNGVTIDETDDTTSMVLWDGVKTLTECHFENTPGSKHAVELTGTTVPSSITWDSTFNSSDFTAGPTVAGVYSGVSNTDAVIYINPTSTVSTPITVNASNGDSPSIRKGSNYTGVITVTLSTVSLTLTGIVNPSEVRIYKTSDKSELSGSESVTSGTYVYEYTYSSDINAYIVILNVDYVPIKIDIVLSDSNSNIPIQQQTDRWYYDAP